LDEFLEKLAEDQRRMREYFGSQSARFKKMGATLGNARERLSRIFLVGEPPVDRVAYLISIEYFLGLPVVLLSVDDKPPTGGEVSKHLARFFKKGDVVVIVANAGQNETLKALFAIAKKKGTHAMLVGGLDAREQWRKLADSAVSLPTRGLRTVCEASLIVARILARCARSYLRDKTGKEEEERIFRADCEKCAHPVFFELQQRGKKTICPHCREPMRSVRSARTSDAPPPAPPSMRIKLPDKTTKKRKREELEAKAAGKDDESEKKPEGEGKDRKPRPNLKQSVMNIPVTQVADFMDESPAEAAIPFDGADAPGV